MSTSRKVRLGSILALTLGLVLASSIGAGAAPVKKLYLAEVTPHNVTEGTIPIFTLTVTNKALTQNLGSCNLTAPAGFTLGTITAQPSQGTAVISGNTIQLRNLGTLPMTSRSVSFTSSVGPASPTPYVWGIECRQSNNFSPDQPSNRYTLDPASDLRTTVSSPLPPADVAVTGNTDSQDPVSGANPVVYTVTVRNLGPNPSGALTLTDSLPNGGTITAVGGDNWSCGLSGGVATCNHASIASGIDAEPVNVYVTTPNQDVDITNRASIDQSGANDPNPGNNTLDETTAVTKDTNCPSGTINCGSGTITYSLLSRVTTGTTTSATNFVVGTTTFQPVAGALGGQIWRMSSPAVPGSFCPINFSSSIVTQCTWQVNLDPIPAVYPVGATLFEAICNVTRCPSGVISGAGTLVVKVRDDGSHQILPACNGGSQECFEQARIAGGHLRIRVRNLIAGDPRIAGVCVGGGC